MCEDQETYGNDECADNMLTVPVTVGGTEVTVKIDLGRIEQQVVDAIIARLNMRERHDHPSIEHKLYSRVLERMDEVVTQRVTELMNRLVRVTDRYGDPRPDIAPLSLADTVARDARQHLAERVMPDGRTDPYKSKSNNNSLTRLEYLVKNHIEEQAAKEIKAMAAEYKDQVLAQVKTMFMDRLAKETVQTVLSKP